MPANPPPPGYTNLLTASGTPKFTTISVIGVVVDCLPPKKSKGSDFIMSLKLQDLHMRDAMYPGEGLKIRYFSPTEEGLPPVKANGDIVLLRDIRVSEFSGEPILLSYRATSHLVFSGSLVPTPAMKLEFVTGNSKLLCHGTQGLRNRLGPVEQDYIITLKSELNIPVQPINAPVLAAPNAIAQPGPGNLAAPTGPAGAYSRKFRLVKDLQHRIFSDICVEVVKKFTNGYGNCELYVTDYTANNKMFYYADPEEKNSLVPDGDRFNYSGPLKRQWSGPYGFLILKVNVTEPHASFANQNVAEGDTIAMENVKIKLMPDSSRLEGDMWPDQNNSAKVQIRKLRRSCKEIEELSLRKEKYWAARLTETESKEKRATEAEAGLSRNQKKKLRAKRKAEEARQKAEEVRQKAEQEAAVAEKKIQSNPHIRCTYKDQPLTTITHILDATNARHTNTLPSGKSYLIPFINARYHTKARVVDFYPPHLADFALQIPHDDDDKSTYSTDMTWVESSPRWEWSFALQVEEVSPRATSTTTSAPPPSRLWLNVGHLEAQHLLGNAVEDPADLREDTALLNQLREKMYILWGDLEERKRGEEEDEDGYGDRTMAKRARVDGEQQEQRPPQPSNLPFNCCLQEYGELREDGRSEEVGDWERQYMIFGVTIN